MIWELRLAARLAASNFTAGTGPVKLILETSRLCNSHCKSCEMWQQPPSAEIHPDALLRAVDSVAVHISWVALTGGEITLYPHLRYLVNGLVSRCPNLLLINLPLNGINPDRTLTLVEQLLRDNRRLMLHTTLSIDGIGQDQDDLRGAGQWPQTVASWTRLQGLRKQYKNLRVSAQMTVSGLNIDKWPAVMARFARESDTFIVAFGMDNRFYKVQEKLVTIGAKPPAMRPLELRASDAGAVAAIVRRYRAWGLGGVVQVLFLLGMLRRLRRGSSGVPCVAGDQVIFISAKGEVRPCPFFERSMGSLGDWGYDLRALLGTPHAMEVKVAASRCDECWNNCVGLASLAASPAKALRLLSRQ